MQTASLGNVRWMTSKDFPQVCAISQDAFLDYHLADEKAVRDVLKHPETVGLVYDLDDRAVAYIFYVLRHDAYYVVQLAVARGFRRMGIGRAMIEALKAKLSRSKRPFLAALATESNLEGHLFLKACGMRAVSVERDLGDEECYLFRFCCEPEYKGEE